MAVFRVEKTRDYTVMANHHLRNTALSLKAKGLLSLMLSLPEDWDYTTNEYMNKGAASAHQPPPCFLSVKWYNKYKSIRKNRHVRIWVKLACHRSLAPQGIACVWGVLSGNRQTVMDGAL